MPKVSIVLPTYNGQDYIRESIDSIISQTFTDWELIIVNDCSNDNTPDIINEYVKKCEKIKIINNTVNQKLPRSLNIGFREAVGEFLTWTSDDNLYLPTAIEKMTNYLETHESEVMVCTKMDYISEKGMFEKSSIAYSNELMYCRDCVGACFLYRKKVLEDIGEYDANFFLVEDYEYWLRILFFYKNIGYIDEVLYKYRNHEKSLTATRRNDIAYNTSKLRRKYIDILCEKLKKRKDYLCLIYFEMARFYGIDQHVYKLFSKLADEIEMDTDVDLDKGIICYGAGDIGNKAYKHLKNKIIYYADRDIRKVGQKMNGITIISILKMVELSSDFPIVVASGAEHIFSFLTTLKENGIKKCMVFKEWW